MLLLGFALGSRSSSRFQKSLECARARPEPREVVLRLERRRRRARFARNGVDAVAAAMFRMSALEARAGSAGRARQVAGDLVRAEPRIEELVGGLRRSTGTRCSLAHLALVARIADSLGARRRRDSSSPASHGLDSRHSVLHASEGLEGGRERRLTSSRSNQKGNLLQPRGP